MTDPSIAEFNSRIARIEKARSRGFGFEAEGTLGRSFYTKGQYQRRRGFPVLRPVIASIVIGVALKALFLHQLGTQAYDARVAALLQGHGIDRIGGILMQADPLTQVVAKQFGDFAVLAR